MKVMHYCDAFSPLSQTFIYDVIIQLDKIGVSNVVGADKLVNQIDRPYSNAFQIIGKGASFADKVIGRFNKICGVSKNNVLAEREGKEKKTNALRKFLCKHKPDIIHAHFGTQGIIVLPIAKELSIPLIVSFHGFDAFKLPKEPNQLVELQNVFKGATYITVVSEVMRKHLISLGCPSDKLCVIHVGKNIEEYKFKEEVGEYIRNFVSIGRLTQKKGHDDCIKAFKTLSEKYNDVSLQIIGSGELEEKLNELIKKENISDKVKLLGAINHIETKKLLANADAFILCSKTSFDGDSEGIPTVLMEAQAMGLPCISTRHSGIPEVIPVQNHWMLAEEGSVESIVNTVEAVMLATKESIQNARLLGREIVEKDFNLVQEVYKLNELYKRVSIKYN